MNKKLVVAGISLWIFLIIDAPLIFSIFGENFISSFAKKLFGFVCHQIQERSFSVFGNYFPVCSRCFAIYVSFYLGFTYFYLKSVNKIKLDKLFIFGLILIPILIDVMIDFFGIYSSNFYTRTITGISTGMGLSLLISIDLLNLNFSVIKRKVKY